MFSRNSSGKHKNNTPHEYYPLYSNPYHLIVWFINQKIQNMSNYKTNSINFNCKLLQTMRKGNSLRHKNNHIKSKKVTYTNCRNMSPLTRTMLFYKIHTDVHHQAIIQRLLFLHLWYPLRINKFHFIKYLQINRTKLVLSIKAICLYLYYNGIFILS